MSPVVIDPDAFLEIEGVRVWTPERSAEAWRLAREALRAALRTAVATGSVRGVVVVCGLQGAGKSTRISRQERDTATVYVDAVPTSARHRAPVIAIARGFGAPADAVWIRTLLPVALERNQQRPLDGRVPEASIRSVDRLFELPTSAEGFASIRIVES
ncbi:AAA family ATPase [Methylobacterium sp. A49B]